MVCLIVQLIVLASVDFGVFSGLNDTYMGFDKDGNKIKQCLVFLPCVTFGLCVDIQILISTRAYRPVAFSDLPFRLAKACMMCLGILSVLTSICSYLFCFVVFGGISKDPDMRKWVFVCFLAKTVTWSPFLALEMYDMLFEQIYHDVQFQLNVIGPNGSKTESPRGHKSNGSKGSHKLSAVLEEAQGDAEALDEENDRSNATRPSGPIMQKDEQSLLLRPTSMVGDLEYDGSNNDSYLQNKLSMRMPSESNRPSEPNKLLVIH